MKDVNGNIVKAGDVLLEETGGGSGGGMKSFRSFTLWEMPSRYDGQGYHYSLDGSKYLFAWADINESVKLPIKELPKDFVFSFYHGMGNFDSYSEGTIISEIIEDSNWKEKSINASDVSSFTKLSRLKLSSIDDVRKNLDVITTAKYIPNSVISSVIRLAGYKQAVMINGELGLVMFKDMLLFQSIIHTLREHN